jgi:iron complex outermembrane receptor protein
MKRFLVLAIVLSVPASLAQAATTVEVAVSDPEGGAIPGAVVTLVGPGLEAVTDEGGVAHFADVSPGKYEVLVRLPGFLSNRSDITVADAPVRVAVSLSEALHFSESVTVTPSGRDTFESYQPATVLGGEDLQQRLGTTLGATLASEPGVNVRSFGAGNQRPVIRGLDNDRVLILENGSRTGDLSSQSADHGVNLDPATAGRIEVVRGPATLLYGSSALGGVVNLVSEEIPTEPVSGVHGSVTTQGATADENGGIAGDVALGNGRLAVRFNGSAQRTSDYATPDPDLETVPNSFSRSKSGGGGFSFTSPEGFVGASYQYVTTRYGVPFVEEGETTLNPRRHRLDFRGERRNLGGSLIEGIKFQGAYRDYAHDEIEGSGEIATHFDNDTWEGELFLNHRPAGRLSGTWGVWLLDRDYSSAGEEALAPPTGQRGIAGFVYEELEFHRVSLQFGGRLDHTSFDPNGDAVERPGLPARDFTEFSGSVGLLGYLRDAHDLTVAVNFARAARNPSLEELYNLGPHPGNFAFEVGDPNLPTEVGYGFDVSLRYRGQRVAAEGTGFVNRIDQFIFPFQTGEVEDGLPVIQFISADSQLRGLEAHLDIGVTPNVWLLFGGDTVRGELRDGGGPLPRIPPYRLWTGLRYENGPFHLEGEVKNVGEQTRVYGAETPTDGYTLLNLHGSYQLTKGQTVHTFTLRLDNATDELYRNHLSYIKDLAPEVGRSLKVVYGLRF